jgi:hypothetical protein
MTDAPYNFDAQKGRMLYAMGILGGTEKGTSNIININRQSDQKYFNFSDKLVKSLKDTAVFYLSNFLIDKEFQLFLGKFDKQAEFQTPRLRHVILYLLSDLLVRNYDSLLDLETLPVRDDFFNLAYTSALYAGVSTIWDIARGIKYPKKAIARSVLQATIALGSNIIVNKIT